GLRPEFAPGTPECYVELAKQCMDSDPKKRPTATYINALITTWIDELAHESNERIIKLQFLEADKMDKADKMDTKLPNIVQNHPDHNKYTSKPINMQEVTKALSKMAIIGVPVDIVEIPEE
ncbi:388_t:CDS:1, partial [Cetraspora pellucida]